jgi:hypothetical protein
MPLDFSKLTSQNTYDTLISPREIFNALPNKNNQKFQYPRDVQSQVWKYWFDRRDEKDLVIKMNTGSGKTVVGLILLKSSINENKGPCVYVVPDNYLVKQAITEADDLGIETTTDTDSPRFLSGKSILVINIHKLVNGLSVFGVGDEGVKIKIGTILIDDAHACLDILEDQFTISISRNNPAYDSLYQIFMDSLHSQCETKAIEIESNIYSTQMQVPYWVWQKKITDVSRILFENNSENDIKFSLPLIKESLHLCRCIISSNLIEISPHCIPIHMIPSIENANRRVFLTASLVDDSILISHFDAADEAVTKAIFPDTASDIGDRMIIMPQVINTEFSSEIIRDFCKNISEQINVVVIVPSEYRSKFWSDEADLILHKDNLYDGIERLKTSHVGLVVLVNRYDGIDLPKDACRLLVIDGLPDVRRLLDKVNSAILMDSNHTKNKLIQKIEQGMGRGVRSNDDHCVVFLMGRNLTRQLYSGKAIDKFSPGTKAQFDLSEKLSEQISNKDISELLTIINYCLKRDNEWIKASKGVLAKLIYKDIKEIDKVTVSQRKAYDHSLYNNNQKAVDVLNKTVNDLSDKKVKPYLKQCLAEYMNFIDEADSQRILMSAASLNTRVLKPIEGIAYHKLTSDTLDQAKNCSEFLTDLNNDPNKIIIELNGISEHLIFLPDTSNIFEEAVKNIARFIGFNSQRPENEYHKGPDDLWEIGKLNYLIIECKNGSNLDFINKHDCNQLNGSANWFLEKYDNTCKYTPVMIHKSNIFEYAASPHLETRIITEEELKLFYTAVQQFIKAICIENKMHDVSYIKEKLTYYKLRSEDIVSQYSIKYKTKDK